MDGWAEDEKVVDFHPEDYFVCEEETVRARTQSIQQHFKKCLKILHTFSLQCSI